jgi:hypothetical protein
MAFGFVAGMAQAVNLRSNASTQATFSGAGSTPLRRRLFFAHFACFLCSFAD